MKKYESRVDVQKFLNRPGHHDGAFVRAYVEDTANRGVVKYSYSGEPANYEARTILQIADCSNTSSLEFNVCSSERRANTFYKVDTLIEALQEFREGLVEESTLYKKRQRALDEYKDSKRTEADREREEKAAEKQAEAEKFFADREVQVEVEHD